MKHVKVWYAKGGDIVKAGPFTTDVEAAASMECVGGGKPENFALWPEVMTTDDLAAYLERTRNGVAGAPRKRE